MRQERVRAARTIWRATYGSGSAIGIKVIIMLVHCLQTHKAQPREHLRHLGEEPGIRRAEIQDRWIEALLNLASRAIQSDFVVLGSRNDERG